MDTVEGRDQKVLGVYIYMRTAVRVYTAPNAVQMQYSTSSQPVFVPDTEGDTEGRHVNVGARLTVNHDH